MASGGDLVLSITPGQQVLSSCSGALLTSLLTTPFDVVRVRLQAQQQARSSCYLMECRCLDGVTLCHVTPEGKHIHSPRFTGTVDALFKIARLEGVRSWWKGLSPTLLMAVPATIIYYTGYDQLKVKFGFRPDQKNILAPLLAGSMSRTVAVTAICPIELLRTKLQSRQGYNYRQLVDVARTAVQQNGFLSLWRGLSPMLLRDIPFSISYWIGYELLKLHLSNALSPQFFPLVPFLAGSMSGAIAAVLTNPLDVAKTHMQVELGESLHNPGRRLGAGSFVTVIRSVTREHGYVGLYTGMAPRIAKIAPACAIMIGSYEMCKRYFAEHNLRLSETKLY